MRFVFLIVLAAVVLSVPYLLRGDQSPPGLESAWHSRLSLDWAPSWVELDDGVVWGRAMPFQPYHALLAFDPMLASRLVPAILALISLGLFAYLARSFMGAPRDWEYAALLFLSSPIFVWLGTVSSPNVLSVALVLAGLCLAFRGRAMLAGFAIFVAAFADWQPVVAALVLLLAWRGRGCLGLVAASAVSTISAVALGRVVSGSWPEISAKLYLADAGVLSGVSLFAFFLAGLAGAWGSRPKRVIFWGGIVIGLAFFLPGVVPFAGMALSVLGSWGLSALLERDWALPMLRTLSISAVVCGLLFSLIVAVAGIARLPPSDSLAVLLDAAEPHIAGGVATVPDVAVLLQRDGFRVLSDGFPGASRADERERALHTVFYGRSLNGTLSVLRDWDIGSIVITKEMRSGLVWDRPEEGLLFLLANNETFKRSFSDGNVEVWQVLQ